MKPGWAGGNPLPHPPVNEKGLIDDLGRRKPAFGVVRDVYLRDRAVPVVRRAAQRLAQPSSGSSASCSCVPALA